MKRWMLFVVFVVAACKQGPGDRCQINSDCQAGLVCNSTRQVCQGPSDGGLADAPVDAVDATVR